MMKALLSSGRILVAVFVILLPIIKAKYALKRSDTDWESPLSGKRSMGDEYTPLCREKRAYVEIKDGVHFFRPHIYTEVLCESSEGSDDGKGSNTELCSEISFRCVQQYSTIYIWKAASPNEMNDCWHFFETRKIPYGCSCMRPPEIQDGF